MLPIMPLGNSQDRQHFQMGPFEFFFHFVRSSFVNDPFRQDFFNCSNKSFSKIFCSLKSFLQNKTVFFLKNLLKTIVRKKRSFLNNLFFHIIVRSIKTTVFLKIFWKIRSFRKKLLFFKVCLNDFKSFVVFLRSFLFYFSGQSISFLHRSFFSERHPFPRKLRTFSKISFVQKKTMSISIGITLR